MIVTVTPNPALDLTYTLDHLRLGESQRPTSERAVAGGKGINVASVLRGFGYAVAALGLVGGPTGTAIQADLAARGIDPAHLVPIAGVTRRTVNLLADGVATMINEAGPTVRPDEWARLEGAVAERTGRNGRHVLVVSGSLPRGIGADGYDRLIRAAGPGTMTIVDGGGPALAVACAGRPSVVKPNRAELAAATGHDDLLTGARELRRRGAESVLVSDGAAGVVLVSGDGTAYRARLDAPLQGNPTGAGDALAAAVAVALLDGDDVVAMLRRGVAWSAAAVLAPVAGEVDPARAAELSSRVVVSQVVSQVVVEEIP